MRQLFQRIFNDHRWFIGFMVVLMILFLFFWRLIDHEGFTNTINGFLADLWEICKTFIALFFIGVGLALIVGWRPFRRRNRGGGH